jgi:hypothetical protein
MILTLEMFLSEYSKYPKSAYVTHDHFCDLYLRKGPMYIGDVRYEKTITIASIRAKRKSQGHFTKFLEELITYQPEIILVECVMNKRLQVYLLRNDFKQKDPNNLANPTFYKETKHVTSRTSGLGVSQREV